MSDLERCVEFLRSLLRVESPPGEEGEAADLVCREMERLGYDRVETDEAGNVIGRIEGGDGGPGVMLVTHLDHVDAGDPGHWERPPFGGVLEEGRVWGRGAVDIKGPLAAQVHGAARLLRDGRRPPGDVCVTAVVQEEVGGLGARHLVGHLRPSLVVVGEPSANELRRGHRGRVELEVRLRGRSVHASVPGTGANPLPALGAFLVALEDLELPRHPELGAATLAPTLLETDQRSANVIPGEVRLACDCRTVPGQDREETRAALAELLGRCLSPGVGGEVTVPVVARTSYTGLRMDLPADNPAFLLPEDAPALSAAGDVLEDALGRRPDVGVWRFATDGGHFAAAGATVVGFGPGEEAVAHTVEERIEVEALARAMDGYEALARDWPARVAASAA